MPSDLCTSNAHELDAEIHILKQLTWFLAGKNDAIVGTMG